MTPSSRLWAVVAASAAVLLGAAPAVQAADQPRRIRIVPDQPPAMTQMQTTRSEASAALSITPDPLTPQATTTVQVVEPVVSHPAPATPRAAPRRGHSRPTRVAPIAQRDLAGRDDKDPQSTAVSKRIAGLEDDLREIAGAGKALSTRLETLQRQNDALARAYYAHVATITAQLQAGTTPANPRLTRRVDEAEDMLGQLSGMIGEYTGISREAGDLSARTMVLSQEATATFALPGALESDHAALSALEDATARTMVSIERIGRTVNGDITRAGRYERSERENLRLLSLAVNRGDMYGAGPNGALTLSGGDGRGAARASGASWQPLLKVTFDRPDVAYEAPLYAAVSEALTRRPGAFFELVSVYPAEAWGSEAAAIPAEATALDRHAAGMRDALTSMGLPPERVRTSSRWGKDPASAGAVYLYLAP